MRPHRSHPPDSEKLIFIQNKKGRYYYGIGPRSSELPDSIAHTALFISNHHQKSLDAETKAIDPNNYYRIDQQLGSTTWLDLPAERVILAGIPEHKPHEAIVTTAFPNLLGYYFTSLKKLPSMPLRFTFYEYGRFTDLTATSLKLQKVPDHLFELEPGYTTMTMFQMLEDISKMN
ncbi:hypothetical protein HNQ92_005810 [Rhabdobacter roseus]|uniref:Uncharacterized protein n=1 Tax=Rhabdobacter roseus TaxID=1655419 RepID=A0A840U224_9BACT|nr:hypothetical protein [Rhabdobacter roseus]MBB5287643.1 hypothetical protein [Rhabdobacter roseus]